MNDNKIIKALECCIKGTTSDVCVDCPLRTTDICTEEENGVLKLALDLINHQQADNERLKKLLEEAEAKYTKCAKRFYKEGIKEFAKRLKDYYINHKRYKRPYAHTLIDYLFDIIDDLVKEMVGDNDEKP